MKTVQEKSMNTEAQMKHIWDQWHKMIVAQDLEGLMKLYHEDATIDSSAVLVLEKEPSGILHGKDKLRKHFGAFFEIVKEAKGKEWHRLDNFNVHGNRIIWEYPSLAPNGSQQLDVIESFDVENGLITYHRVYWGRVGFDLLTATAKR